MFDDVDIDKDFLYEIVKVRLQFNGNELGIFKGVGVVGGIYINPFLAWFWITKYHICDPDEMVRPSRNMSRNFRTPVFLPHKSRPKELIA